MTQKGQIHPSAVLSRDAEIAEDAVVGPFTVIDGPVRIGAGTVIGPRVHLVAPLTIGTGNCIHAGAVIGDGAQHLRCNELGGVVIGNNNIIHEGVTIHTATRPGQPTTLGDNNFLMANSHVAHDCRIGNHCTLTNGALLGGHCIIEDSAYLSGNCVVHQFCRIGRLALVSGNSGASKDIPCFAMVQGVNTIVNLNVIGMRRAGITNEQIATLRRVYRILFREGLGVSTAVERIETQFGHEPIVTELLTFIRGSERGVLTHTRAA